MSYSIPKNNWTASQVLTAVEVNKQADNDIWLASLLMNGAALSTRANGTELNYGLNAGFVDGAGATYSHTVSVASTMESFTTAPTLSIDAASTRPILVATTFAQTLAGGVGALQIALKSGTGGTLNTSRSNGFSNTVPVHTPFFLMAILSSPIKGNTYVFELQVQNSGLNQTNLQWLDWFGIAL